MGQGRSRVISTRALRFTILTAKTSPSVDQRTAAPFAALTLPAIRLCSESRNISLAVEQLSRTNRSRVLLAGGSVPFYGPRSVFLPGGVEWCGLITDTDRSAANLRGRVRGGLGRADADEPGCVGLRERVKVRSREDARSSPSPEFAI